MTSRYLQIKRNPHHRRSFRHKSKEYSKDRTMALRLIFSETSYYAVQFSRYAKSVSKSTGASGSLHNH